MPPVAEGPFGFAPGAGQARAHRDLVVFLRRLAQLGLLIVLLVVGGTVGFVLTENVSAWFGFVWTVDTIATVGAVPPPETTGGQVIKVLLIVLGVGTLFYGLVAVTEFFVAGHVTGLLRAHRRQRVINAHSDHCIGVYCNVSEAGVLAEGEQLEFDAGTTSAKGRAGTRRLKRGALRVVDAFMPRGS